MSSIDADQGAGRPEQTYSSLILPSIRSGLFRAANARPPHLAAPWRLEAATLPRIGDRRDSGRPIQWRKSRQVDSATSTRCVSTTTTIIGAGDRYDAKCVTAP
jgi:hypothetical protein